MSAILLNFTHSAAHAAGTYLKISRRTVSHEHACRGTIGFLDQLQSPIAMNTAIVGLVDFCARYRWIVIIAGALLLLATAAYAAARFSINTDVEGLIAQNIPWHERQVQLAQAFPQRAILAVVKAPTAENAEIATNELARALAENPNLFPDVAQPDSGDFFERNGLLLGSASDVQKAAQGLAHAQPFLAALAGDPSPRGVMTVLASAAEGVQAGRIKLEQLAWPLSLAKRTLSGALSGRPAFFSWQELLQGHALPDSELRHFVEVAPKLDFTALQPGHAATEAIHKAAADLNLDKNLGAAVSLTGQVPMNDDQFSVIRSSAALPFSRTARSASFDPSPTGFSCR